ncbi:hypothetical protein RF11_03885 [Thelohanellus kitauei]|uniref:DUF1758 domain-containing protein n=1 Tax=Thelohanellus kitauei TaxID=669202 RepID=A0A0C2MRW8_THEKT|nr:hypothetical protein RF11_03885 [Thelohanellus kitauei]
MAENIFFDTGSYRSYIHSDLAKSLNFHLDKAEKISIDTFNSNRSKIIKSWTAEIFIHSKIVSIRAKFNTINEICNISPGISRYRKIVERHDITDLSYTEINHCFDKIDVLIGSDLCWELIKSINRLDDKVFLLNTQIGKVITGKINEPRA